MHDKRVKNKKLVPEQESMNLFLKFQYLNSISFLLQRDGTYTTKSSLIFKASHWENGKTIHCYAENEVIKNNNEPELHEVLVLDVRCK